MSKMTKWRFLEPWRLVLRGSLTTEIVGALSFVTRLGSMVAGNDFDPVLQVSISFAENNSTPKTICLKLPMDETSRRDTSRQRKLREAVELFTLLSIVNYRAFTELMTPETDESHPVQTSNHQVQLPRWTLQLVGALSPKDSAAVQSQVTWGALLGFPDDPRGYSAEFRDAITKLEAMGMEEESIKGCVSNGLSIRWGCAVEAVALSGNHTAVAQNDPSNPLRGQFRKLFNSIAPPVAKICATQGCTMLVPEAESLCLPTEPCKSLHAAIWNWYHPAITEFTTALARTPISRFTLSFEMGALCWQEPAMNVGYLLNSLICGRPLCSRGTIRLEYGKLDLHGDTDCDSTHVAICSAIAELSVDAHVRNLTVRSRGTERWSWLVYALCCGDSDVLVPSVNISNSKLTKSDVLAVSAVLQTNYPQPAMESDGEGCHQYGFADIQEGAELHLCGLRDDEDSRFVASRACHCRALYDRADDDEWVNVVVPGYGHCRAKLGGGVQFSPDSGNPDFQTKRLCRSLTMNKARFESAAVLTDLLALTASGLRKLTLTAAVSTSAIQFDLCVLAAACPKLQYLSVTEFTVVVSAHSESLRRWPIRKIFLSWSGERTSTMPDLTRCLRNPELRMSRQILKLEVRPPWSCSFAGDEELVELQSLDGEFLPLTKAKLPVESKAAILSVVRSDTATAAKPIHLLDANTLSLIFVFAATPARREVKCWTAADYESE